jgi:hypothetical protein
MLKMIRSFDFEPNASRLEVSKPRAFIASKTVLRVSSRTLGLLLMTLLMVAIEMPESSEIAE